MCASFLENVVCAPLRTGFWKENSSHLNFPPYSWKNSTKLLVEKLIDFRRNDKISFHLHLDGCAGANRVVCALQTIDSWLVIFFIGQKWRAIFAKDIVSESELCLLFESQTWFLCIDLIPVETILLHFARVSSVRTIFLLNYGKSVVSHPHSSSFWRGNEKMNRRCSLIFLQEVIVSVTVFLNQIRLDWRNIWLWSHRVNDVCL